MPALKPPFEPPIITPVGNIHDLLGRVCAPAAFYTEHASTLYQPSTKTEGDQMSQVSKKKEVGSGGAGSRTLHPLPPNYGESLGFSSDLNRGTPKSTNSHSRAPGDGARFAHLWTALGYPGRSAWRCAACDAWSPGDDGSRPAPGYCTVAARAYVQAEVDAADEILRCDVRRLRVLRAPVTPDPSDVLAVCGLCGAAVEPLQDIIAFRLLVLHEGCAEIIAKIMSGGES